MTTKEIIKKLNKSDSIKFNEDDLEHVSRLCEKHGIDPTVKPFIKQYNQVYATKSCSNQLVKNNNITHKILSKDVIDGVYIVHVEINKNGNITHSLGACSFENAKGSSKENAFMKAHTKAVRRGVLDACNLSIYDETEMDFAKEIESSRPSSAAPAPKQERRVEPTKPDFEKIVNEKCVKDDDSLKSKKVVILKHFNEQSERYYNQLLKVFHDWDLQKVETVINENNVKI